MHDIHTAVIGAGSGGLTVAVGLAKLGRQVVLIEREHVGGDCTNVGCIPSKTLIHLAGHDQGLSGVEVLERVRERRNALRDEETEWVESMQNMRFIRGTARFVDTHSLEVVREGASCRLRAKNIVIATGSKPVRLEIDGLPGHRTLTNESLFDVLDPPVHLVIVGGGIIGSEMAFAFRSLGSRVTILDNGERVLSPLEPEVSDLIARRLRASGVKLYLQAEVTHFNEQTRTLHAEQQGQSLAVPEVDQVLLAVGRTPNVVDLNLEGAGVRFDKRGIPTNNAHQTTVRHIYAIGDVSPRSAFTHSANAQGRRVVRKLLLPWLPLGREPSYPSATFSEPEVAQIGPPYAELVKHYHPTLIRTIRIELKDTDRGYTIGLKDGFLLLHAVKLTGRVLSATIVAPNASEMISLLTSAVYQGQTLYSLSNLVFPYPVLSEAIKKAADDFVFSTLPKLPSELWAYLRYSWASPRARIEKSEAGKRAAQ